MSTRKTLEERLTELGGLFSSDSGFSAEVMRRIAQPGGSTLTWRDLLQIWVNQNSAVVTVLVIGLLGVSMAFIVERQERARAAAAAPPPAWFYDTTTGVLFTDEANRVPPIFSPAGNPAVRAHVFSCGDCSESHLFTGYYERCTEELKTKLEENPQAAMLYAMWTEGREYSSDGKTWHAASSPEGAKILQAVGEKCPAKKLRYCPPSP